MICPKCKSEKIRLMSVYPKRYCKPAVDDGEPCWLHGVVDEYNIHCDNCKFNFSTELPHITYDDLDKGKTHYNIKEI